MSFIHKFKNRASWQSLGLEGSTVRGRTRCGGLTSPTLSTSGKAPVCRRSIRVRLTKSAKGLHDKLFLKCSEGGRSELYCFPLKLPEKGWKYSKIDTSSSIHFKTWACWGDGESPAICLHWSLYLWISPARKQPGSLKRKMAGSPSFSPQIVWLISPSGRSRTVTPVLTPTGFPNQSTQFTDLGEYCVKASRFPSNSESSSQSQIKWLWEF